MISKLFCCSILLLLHKKKNLTVTDFLLPTIELPFSHHKSKSHVDTPYPWSSNGETEASWGSTCSRAGLHIAANNLPTRCNVANKNRHGLVYRASPGVMIRYAHRDTLCEPAHRLFYNQPISCLYNLPTHPNLTHIMRKHSHPATIHN